MQDRFKFRVWKKYSCPSYGGHKPEMFYDAEKTYDFLLNKIPENCFADILEDEKEYIVMQCTGLKDKNGKLIYEGDVVTYEWLTPLGKVWRNDGKYIVEWSDGFCLLSNIARYDVEHGTKRNVEIIGNIYENPELLGEKQCN